MNSNKDIYILLKFTVVCHLIILLLAVLSPAVLSVEGKLSILIYMKIVLCCSVLFYAALAEFVFGL